MSKKMGLLSLLVSTIVLSTSIKAEGVTVTNSSDVAITQDTELLTSSDGSMNVFMEEPQTETSTSATDISSSDATMSSSVSEAIVDSVEETTPTETEVIVSEEEDVIVSEEAPNTTQIVNEPIVTQVEEPVATADVLFESENGEISEISLEPIIGKLTRLMQILPETGSLNGDTSIITGVVMLMSAIILFLYGFAKRIFN